MGTDCDQTLVGGNRTKTGYTNVPDPQPHISSNSLTKWLPGAELVYGRGGSGASWTEPRCTVTSVAAGAAAGTVDIIMAQPCWDRAVGKGPSIGTGQGVTHPSDVENSLEFLQSPLLAKGSDGEWFGDFAANTVYYKPLPVRHTAKLFISVHCFIVMLSVFKIDSSLVASKGEKPDGIKAVLGTVPKGGAGSASVLLERGTERVKFTNLVFEYNTWLQPSSGGGFVDLQSGYYFVRFQA